MPKDYRETTITIDHDAKLAHIWTNNRRIDRKMSKLGATEVRRAASGVAYTLPEATIRFRKAVKSHRPATTRQLQALAAANAAKVAKI